MFVFNSRGRGVRILWFWPILLILLASSRGSHHHYGFLWLFPLVVFVVMGRIARSTARRMPRPAPEIPTLPRRAPPRGDLRVSDDDRERVVDFLREQLVAGRVRSDEFDGRVTAALAAQTWDEVRAVTRDLPERF
jgi:hypothetical protein